MMYWDVFNSKEIQYTTTPEIARLSASDFTNTYQFSDCILNMQKSCLFYKNTALDAQYEISLRNWTKADWIK